jgi:UDP-N-acetylglucosamine--N-acetylmuramyl-(pentapeptide) pyrophosphoryl-undecaprenol N-acetylglucosamine transferase
LIVHEANRAPGFTNRLLAKFARRVLCGFPGSFRRGGETVGNPVRAEVANLPPPAQRFGGRDGILRLLVVGGSQGARALNNAVPRALAALAGLTVEVRHQSGENLRTETESAYANAGVRASIEPFIQDMAEAYGWADLVVCRAGAMTLAEVCAAGVGSLLVPFPLAVDDHQTRNAAYLVERGAARLLPQHDDLESRLGDALSELLVPDRTALLAMAERARAAALPDATARVADICIEEARA